MSAALPRPELQGNYLMEMLLQRPAAMLTLHRWRTHTHLYTQPSLNCGQWWIISRFSDVTFVRFTWSTRRKHAAHLSHPRATRWSVFFFNYDPARILLSETVCLSCCGCSTRLTDLNSLLDFKNGPILGLVPCWGNRSQEGRTPWWQGMCVQHLHISGSSLYTIFVEKIKHVFLLPFNSVSKFTTLRMWSDILRMKVIACTCVSGRTFQHFKSLSCGQDVVMKR